VLAASVLEIVEPFAGQLESVGYDLLPELAAGVAEDYGAPLFYRGVIFAWFGNHDHVKAFPVGEGVV